MTAGSGLVLGAPLSVPGPVTLSCGIADSFTRTVSTGQAIYGPSPGTNTWGGWGTAECGLAWIYDNDYWGNNQPADLKLFTDGNHGVMTWTPDYPSYHAVSMKMLFPGYRASEVTATVHCTVESGLWDPNNAGTFAPEISLQLSDGDAESGTQTFSLSAVSFYAPSNEVLGSSRGPTGLDSQYAIPNNPWPALSFGPIPFGFTMKLRGTANGMDGKIWKDGTPEPEWQLSYHGHAGKRYSEVMLYVGDLFGGGTTPVRVEWDNLELSGIVGASVTEINRCSGICATDNFQRAAVATPNWGTATGGLPWLVTKSNGGTFPFYTDGYFGILDGSSASSSTYRFLGLDLRNAGLAPPGTPCELYMLFQYTGTWTSVQITLTDTKDPFAATDHSGFDSSIFGGAIHFFPDASGTGTETTGGTSVFPVSGSTDTYNLRVRWPDTKTVQVKCWRRFDAEPADWQATDSWSTETLSHFSYFQLGVYGPLKFTVLNMSLCAV